MPCDAYLAAMTAMASTLTADHHPNIQPPTGGIGLALPGVQGGVGGINIFKRNGVAPPAGDTYLPTGETVDDSVYVSFGEVQGQPDSWLEQWVVRNPNGYAAGAPLQLWSQVSGDVLDDEEWQAIEKEDVNAAFRLASMAFKYRLLPAALGAVPASDASCAATRHLFHAVQLVDHVVGPGPVGVLFREVLTLADGSQRFVDHWILRADYRPPQGTDEVLLVRQTAAVPTHLRDFFRRYRFMAGAGPLGTANDLVNARYVQIVYSLEDPPYVP